MRIIYVYVYYILWPHQTYSLLKGWVHLGRGHSAVMFVARSKIQKLYYNLVTVIPVVIWLFGWMYTAITHMIIALGLQSLTCHVSLEFT